MGKSLSLRVEDDSYARTAVIERALAILIRIHAAFVALVEVVDQSDRANVETEDVALEDAKRRRLLHALLDLISLEGFYPSLSIGAGIPLQSRVISVLPAGVIAKPSATISGNHPQNEALLDRIMSAFLEIVFDERPSIQIVIRGRLLSDLISGTADLAYNSNLVADEKNRYRAALGKVINEYVYCYLLREIS